MRNFKRFLAMALTMLMVIGCVSLSAFAFDDYVDGEFSPAAENLASKGIVYGESATELNPDAPVNRWQAALFMARMASGKTSAEDQNKFWYSEVNTTNFTDVKPEHYIGSIQFAVNYNFFVGTSETTFEPEAQIILQDFLTMAVRALGLDLDASGKSIGSAGYPWKYISIAVANGLDAGLENVAYTAPLTRIQTIQLLENLFYAKNTAGKSFAIEVFGDYSREPLTNTAIVLATEKSAMPGESFTAAGKIKIAQLSTDGTYTDAATINASKLGFEVLAGDSFRYAGNVDYAVKGTSVVTKLVAGHPDLVKDRAGKGVQVNQVLIGTDAVNVKLDAADGGIVLFKVYQNYAKVEGINTVIFDIGGGWAQTWYVKAFDDNGDGALDRGYIFNTLSGKIAMYTPDDWDRDDGTHLFDLAGNKNIQNFVNFNSKAAVEIPADKTYVNGFYDATTETLYCLELVTPGTYTKSGVLTEIGYKDHTVTVDGKKYYVGTNYDGPFQFTSVLPACQNLSETMLNMTVRLIISEDEEVVVGIETQESDGKAFGIVSSKKDKETGVVTAKALAYKGTATETIEVVAVDGTFGEKPEAGKIYAGHKDFNGKWMLYSNASDVYNLSSWSTGKTASLDFTYGRNVNTSGIHFSFATAYTATQNTKFQIWDGENVITFTGKPGYDAVITGLGGNDLTVSYEWEKEITDCPEIQPHLNGIYEETYYDEDEEEECHDYYYRFVLKNVFVWQGTFSGSYTDPNGTVVAPSTLDYDDIVMAQNFPDRREMAKAVATINPADLQAVKDVVGGTVSKVYKWSNVYSIKTGTFVTVAEANEPTLEIPVAHEHPKFYYVKNGVVVGECELGNEIVDGAIVASSHEGSVAMAFAGGALRIINFTGAVDGPSYMNWFGAFSIDGNNNPTTSHNCTTVWYGPADYTQVQESDIVGYRNSSAHACYIYVGPLTDAPVVIFHDPANTIGQVN